MFGFTRLARMLSLVAVAVAMVPSLSTAAQESRGALVGSVAVAGNVPVADASLLARSLATGREVATTTSADGTWRLENLEPGDWLLVISAAGLADAIERVIVRADGPVQVHTTMHVQSVQEQVTVTATKTERDVFLVPGEVSVVGREQLDNAQARSLDDAVRYLPNVEMGATRRQLQAPNIRGFDDRRVLVLRDGARVSQFDSAHKGDVFLEVNDIERIEVVRGPASALYGSGALGGVIAITSRDPADLLRPGQSIGGSVATSWSSAYGEGMINPRLFGGTGSGFGWTLGYTARRNDGSVRIGGSDEEMQRAEEDVDSFNARATIPVGSAARFRVSFDGLGNRGDTLSNLSLTEIGADYEVFRRTRQYTGTVAFQADGAHWWNEGLVVNTWFNDVNIDEDRARDARQEDIGYRTWGVDARNSVRVGDHTLTYGVEGFHDRQIADRNGELLAFFPNGSQTQFGLYLQDEIQLLDDRLSIVPGVRVDIWSSSSEDIDVESDSRAQVNPKIGVVYELFGGLAATAGYARGFRAPMLNELFLTGVHFAFPLSPRVFVIGLFRPNPDLDPESSQNVDVGLRYRAARVDARVAYYRAEVSGFIDTRFDEQEFVPSEGVLFWYFDTYNVADATLHGWEASASWLPVDALLLRGAWSAPRGTNDATGERLGSLTPDKLALGAEVRAIENVTLGVNARFYGDDPGVVDVMAPQDAFQLVDVYGSWRLSFAQDVTLFVNLDNVADTAYRIVPFGLPGPGRDVRIGMTWSLGR